MGFIEVTADIEDLESGTLARWAAVAHSFVDPGWAGQKVRLERGDSYTVYSWLQRRRRCMFEVASGTGDRRRERRRNVRLHVVPRHLRRTAGDKPNFRPHHSLTGKDLLAGTPLSKSVGPRPLQSRAVRALLKLGKLDVSRRSSGPTLLEARAPLGAGAGSGRICFNGKAFRALLSKSDALPCQPLNPVEVLAELDRFRSGRSLKEKCGANPETPSTADLERQGSSGWVASPTCNAFHAPVTSAPELSSRRTRRKCERT